jgi:hypothetical protein
MNTNLVIAVDIDDTITDTARQTFELAKKSFTHHLSVEDLLFRYSQPGEVTEWQTEEVDMWLEKHLGSSQYLATMPVLVEAQKALQRLSKKVTIACYITSRLHFMNEMTKDWLTEHDFPKAQLITRAFETRDVNWKLAELKKTFSEPVHLIDDNLGKMSDELLADYSGSLIWYNPLGQKPNNSITKNAASWQEIETLLTTI